MQTRLWTSRRRHIHQLVQRLCWRPLMTVLLKSAGCISALSCSAACWFSLWHSSTIICRYVDQMFSCVSPLGLVLGEYLGRCMQKRVQNSQTPSVGTLSIGGHQLPQRHQRFYQLQDRHQLKPPTRRIHWWRRKPISGLRRVLVKVPPRIARETHLSRTECRRVMSV